MQIRLDELFWTCHTTEYKTIGRDVNYKFIEEKSTLYIYFQGSSSVTDWIRNFLFFKKPYKGMKIPYYVHGGFLKAWKEVEDIVIDKIKEKKQLNYNGIIFDIYKYNKIIIVGYSHGGALSGFCHECIWFHRPDIRDNIFGFGFESPRFYRGLTVKKELRERWDNYYVIRNYKDIVTYAPPKLFLFTHVGQIIHLQPQDTTAYIKPKCISAHFPENVLQSLKEYHLEI